jgi:hypothetical protein
MIRRAGRFAEVRAREARKATHSGAEITFAKGARVAKCETRVSFCYPEKIMQKPVARC